MEGVRFSRMLWTVARVERDEDGRDDGYVECGHFWTETEAVVERDRLSEVNEEERYYYVVTWGVATGVYPADEQPPWVDDPDRLKKRGYETVD